MHCSKCGTQSDSSVSFCPTCGSALFGESTVLQSGATGVFGVSQSGAAVLNRELTAAARARLSGKWNSLIPAFLIVIALSCLGMIPKIGLFISLLFTGPLTVGAAYFSLKFIRDKNPKTGDVLEGFNHFGKSLGTYLLMALFILLWTLLLIVPGIMKAFSYAMVFFIRADEPDLGMKASLKKSEAMMKGWRLKYFLFCCRFIGWGLLALCTAGIGFLWLMPYFYISLAGFYEDVKARYVSV